MQCLQRCFLLLMQANKPSRSARRKAAKRRLRRIGVLPRKATQVEIARPAAAAAAGPADELLGKPASGPVAAALPQRAAAAQRHQAVRQGDRKPAAAAAGAPEVTVPPDWQQQWQPEAQPQPLPERGRQGREPHSREQSAQVQAGGKCPLGEEPMSEAAFGQLPPLAGLPSVGVVLAYRLLEVGPALQPGVSEVRCGR